MPHIVENPLGSLPIFEKEKATRRHPGLANHPRRILSDCPRSARIAPKKVVDEMIEDTPAISKPFQIRMAVPQVVSDKIRKRRGQPGVPLAFRSLGFAICTLQIIFAICS